MTPVAAEIVYVEGPILAAFVFGFVFVFIALTDDRWFLGAGFLALVVAGLFAYFSWRSLPDHPLTYRDGAPPSTDVQGTGLYETWVLDPGETMATDFEAGDASNATSLTNELRLGFGCPTARVDWRIQVDGAVVVSGTFREGQKRDLTKVAVRPGDPPTRVRLTATRRDSARCSEELIWHNSGLEGPGNGEFRFVFPLPEE